MYLCSQSSICEVEFLNLYIYVQNQKYNFQIEIFPFKLRGIL